MKPYNFNLENFTNYNYIIENFANKPRNIKKFLGFSEGAEKLDPTDFKAALRSKAVKIAKESNIDFSDELNLTSIEFGILDKFNTSNLKFKNVKNPYGGELKLNQIYGLIFGNNVPIRFALLNRKNKIKKSLNSSIASINLELAEIKKMNIEVPNEIDLAKLNLQNSGVQAVGEIDTPKVNMSKVGTDLDETNKFLKNLADAEGYDAIAITNRGSRGKLPETKEVRALHKSGGYQVGEINGHFYIYSINTKKSEWIEDTLGPNGMFSKWFKNTELKDTLRQENIKGGLKNWVDKIRKNQDELASLDADKRD